MCIRDSDNLAPVVPIPCYTEEQREKSVDFTSLITVLGSLAPVLCLPSPATIHTALLIAGIVDCRLFTQQNKFFLQSLQCSSLRIGIGHIHDRGDTSCCRSTTFCWYAENKRDLPWRNTTDPYLIWISEIILQQTRVAQGYRCV